MENIDDLMKNKFNDDEPQDRFEFQEEYWEQALALIEADEAKQRRKKRFLLLLPLALLLLGWLLCNKSAILHGDLDAEKTSSVKQIGTTAPASGNAAQKGQVVSKGQGDRNEGAQLDSTSAGDSNPASQNAGENEYLTLAKARRDENIQTETLATALKNGAKTTIKPANHKNSLEPRNLRSGEHEIKSGTRDDKTPTTLGAVQGEASTATKGAENKATNEQDKPVSTEKSAGVQSALQSSIGENLPGDGKLSAAPENAKEEQTADDNEKTVLDLPILSRSIPLLILDARTLLLPENLRGQLAPADKQETKIFVEKKPLIVGIWGAGAFKTSNFENPNPEVLNNPRWGAALGLKADWSPFRFGSFSFGLGLRYVPGAWETKDSLGPVATETQFVKRYSFGFKNTTFTRETLGLLYADLPLGYRVSKEKLGFELGISPRVLILAHNKTTLKEDKPLEDPSTKVNWFRRSDTQGYNPVHLLAFGGIDYAYSKRIRLSLNAGWSPRVPSKTSTGNKHFHYLEAGIRYNFTK